MENKRGKMKIELFVENIFNKDIEIEFETGTCIISIIREVKITPDITKDMKRDDPKKYYFSWYPNIANCTQIFTDGKTNFYKRKYYDEYVNEEIPKIQLNIVGKKDCCVIL